MGRLDRVRPAGVLRRAVIACKLTIPASLGPPARLASTLFQVATSCVVTSPMPFRVRRAVDVRAISQVRVAEDRPRRIRPVQRVAVATASTIVRCNNKPARMGVSLAEAGIATTGA